MKLFEQEKSLGDMSLPLQLSRLRMCLFACESRLLCDKWLSVKCDSQVCVEALFGIACDTA